MVKEKELMSSTFIHDKEETLKSQHEVLDNTP